MKRRHQRRTFCLHNGSQWGPKLFSYQHFMFHRRKKVIWVWNHMRMS